MNGTRTIWWTVLALVCVFVLGQPAFAQSGEDVYSSSCASCHGAEGEGRGSFPALADNPSVADSEYVSEVIEQGAGNMPALTSLEPAEVEAVVEYVESTFAPASGTGTDGEDTPPTSDAPAPSETGEDTGDTDTGELPPGSADRGRSYFLGELRFENGGAACITCHAAAHVADLGGGTLGSDLTDLAERYGGADGVAGALANPAFPVMGAAYEDRPLTPQERSDLGAFFSGLPASAQSDGGVAGHLSPFWIPGALLTALLFALTALLWPRTRTGAAERLRAGAARTADTRPGTGTTAPDTTDRSKARRPK